MTLEHFPEMAEAEIARHVEDALQRWPLLGVTVIHRYGRLTPGEEIVLVVTAASHRHEAFAAAEFLMDFLKTRAPFWKQVEYADGAHWVDAKATDDALAARWDEPPSRPRGGVRSLSPSIQMRLRPTVGPDRSTRHVPGLIPAIHALNGSRFRISFKTWMRGVKAGA